MSDQPLRSRSSEPPETSALSGGGAAPLMMKAGVGSVRKLVLNAVVAPIVCPGGAREHRRGIGVGNQDEPVEPGPELAARRRKVLRNVRQRKGRTGGRNLAVGRKVEPLRLEGAVGGDRHQRQCEAIAALD